LSGLTWGPVAVSQLVQIVGALIILAAFVLAQLNVATPTSRGYLAANLVGSVLLAGVAWAGGQSGFLLLEAAWAVVSAVSLFRRPSQS